MSATHQPPQEMPPKGGFAAIDFKRNLPRRGPHGTTIMVLGALTMGIGFVFLGKGNRERRRLKEEKVAGRIAIIPLLQAEEDRRYLRQKAKFLADEKALMDGVEGYTPGEAWYHTSRFVPPTVVTLVGDNP
eukprot:CFRG3948T1